MTRVPFLTAILARNEAQRYLPEVLDHHGAWGPIYVLDDNSDDGTADLCRAHPAVLEVGVRSADISVVGCGSWGHEAPTRQALWNRAADLADWVLICDADQLLSADPRPLLQSTSVNSWSFILYDLWDSREHYRDDGYWVGHLHPRPWLFNPHRVPDGWRPEWSTRGIHTGHAPTNFPYVVGVAPPEHYFWRHLGYVAAADRAAKLTRYRGQYHQMSPDEVAHAESIASPPSLKILPFAKPVRILCGGPVRKRADVLRAHLASLDAQELPPRVTVDYAFVNDFPEPCEGSQVLADFVAAHAGRLLMSPNPARDFTDEHPVTHQWSLSAMNRMGLLKTMLLQACIQGGYDWLWLVDSDLLLDPTTLASLLSAQKAVVAAVYWTKWHADPRIHSGPQVWLKPPYQLSLPHYPEHEFRTTLGVKRQLEKVAGLGACTLIARSVIEKGVQFGKPPGFSSGGLWDGEDRHFCEWARRLHVELWADAWPDIFHCYHPKDAERLPGMTAWLATPHPTFTNHGHLVSLRLTNIEDGIGPTMVRCRVGDGTLLPELELAVLKMQRGETKIVPIHFPATTPPTGPLKLAGLTRLISVDLIDTKPFTLPPVLGDEFYQTHEVVADTTQFTEAQHAHIAETATA